MYFLNFIKVANFKVDFLKVGESKKEIGCIYKFFSSKSIVWCIEPKQIDEWTFSNNPHLEL